MDWCGRLRAITFLPRAELDSLGSCLIHSSENWKRIKFFPNILAVQEIKLQKTLKKFPLMRNRNETNDWNDY